MSMLRRTFLTLCLSALTLGIAVGDAEAKKPKHVLKIASLAPKGSTWT